MEKKSAKSQGEVIWYSERRGYGFVKLGEQEIFLHHSALNRFGLQTVYPGDQLVVNTSENENGPVIDELLAIERAKPVAIAADTMPKENEVRGTVKFFNSYKGYGFVNIGKDSRDVFVHLRTLRNCGIHHLNEGQEILLNVTDEGKGPQATEVRVFSSE